MSILCGYTVPGILTGSWAEIGGSCSAKYVCVYINMYTHKLFICIYIYVHIYTVYICVYIYMYIYKYILYIRVLGFYHCHETHPLIPGIFYMAVIEFQQQRVLGNVFYMLFPSFLNSPFHADKFVDF